MYMYKLTGTQHISNLVHNFEVFQVNEFSKFGNNFYFIFMKNPIFI